jgi:hypothetical protein
MEKWNSEENGTMEGWNNEEKGTMEGWKAGIMGK